MLYVRLMAHTATQQDAASVSLLIEYIRVFDYIYHQITAGNSIALT